LTSQITHSCINTPSQIKQSANLFTYRIMTPFCL